MANDLISVIVPVYNTEKCLLEGCINSILAQTYDNIEVILVDDGSTDDSGDICDAFADKDSRVKVIHKTNGGVSDACNTGIDAAQGEYMCFVGSDDTIEPDMYESMYKVLIESDADICICGLKEITEEETFITVLPFVDKQSPREFFEGYLKTPQKYASFLYGGGQKTLTKKSVFYTSFVRCNTAKLNNDGPAFNARCIAAAHNGIVFVNRALYNWRSVGHSMVTSLSPENFYEAISSMGEVIKTTLPDEVGKIDKLIKTEYNALLVVSAIRAKQRRIQLPFKLNWDSVFIVFWRSPSFYMKIAAICVKILPSRCFRVIYNIALTLFAPYGRKKI